MHEITCFANAKEDKIYNDWAIKGMQDYEFYASKSK